MLSVQIYIGFYAHKITLKTHSVQLLLCITIDKGKQLINGGVFSFYQQLGTKAKSF